MSKINQSVLIFLSIILCLSLVSKAHGTPTPESGIPSSGEAQAVLHWEDEEGYGTVIGIEIGSSYSRVGILRRDQFSVFVNEQDKREIPSCVALTDDGPLVGFEALIYGEKHPENVICDVRQLLGRRFSNSFVQNHIKSVPYRVVDNNDQPAVQVTINGAVQTVTPEEIASQLTKALKNTAEQYLGREVRYAVATIPAMANDAERQSLRNASIIGGLDVLRVINEQTAAGIAYGMDRNNFEKALLVYNLEAKSFDVTLISIDSGVYETLATARNGTVGGEDFDIAFAQYIVEYAMKESKLEPSNHPHQLLELEEQAMSAEKELSVSDFATIEVPAEGSFTGFNHTFTQLDLRDLHTALFTRSSDLIDTALKEAKLDRSEITDIILTGSPSHIARIAPLFRQLVTFGSTVINDRFPSNEVVIRGATIQGQVLSDEDGADICTLTLDINEVSLGIETQGGVFSKVIPRNIVIPTRKTRTLTTVRDNQEKIMLNVYEGERKVANKNNLLGTLVIDGIPPAPKGVPRIETSFEIDPNYILKASAENKVNEEERTLIVQLRNSTHQRTGDQIDEIIMEAEKYDQEDSEVLKPAAEMQSEIVDGFEAALVVPECPRCPKRIYRGHRIPRPHTSIWDYVSDWVEDVEEVVRYLFEKCWRYEPEHCCNY